MSRVSGRVLTKPVTDNNIEEKPWRVCTCGQRFTEAHRQMYYQLEGEGRMTPMEVLSQATSENNARKLCCLNTLSMIVTPSVDFGKEVGTIPESMGQIPVNIKYKGRFQSEMILRKGATADECYDVDEELIGDYQHDNGDALSIIPSKEKIPPPADEERITPSDNKGNSSKEIGIPKELAGIDEPQLDDKIREEIQNNEKVEEQSRRKYKRGEAFPKGWRRRDGEVVLVDVGAGYRVPILELYHAT